MYSASFVLHFIEKPVFNHYLHFIFSFRWGSLSLPLTFTILHHHSQKVNTFFIFFLYFFYTIGIKLA
nr:MAG TPA: hypothetical protein [Caudoviricetes sp.]